MLTLLVYVLVACLLASLALWLLAQFAPEPVQRVGRAVVLVVLVLWLVGLLLGFPGGWAPAGHFRHGWG